MCGAVMCCERVSYTTRGPPRPEKLVTLENPKDVWEGARSCSPYQPAYCAQLGVRNQKEGQAGGIV